MTFNIKCPICGGEISETSFNNDTKAMAHLQQFFNAQEQKFKAEIEKKLLEEFKISKDHEIQNQLSRQKMALVEENNRVINDLKQQITQLQARDKTQQEIFKSEISKKELAFNQLKQQEIDRIKSDNQKNINELNARLNDLTTKEKTHLLQVKELLAKKELEIKELKQREITELHQKIAKLEANDKVNQETFKTEISKKELAINQLKQQEIDRIKSDYQKNINELNARLNDLTTKEKTMMLQLKELVAKKELEITELKQQELNQVKGEHQKLIDSLNTKINELITSAKVQQVEVEKLLKENELAINKLKQQEIDTIKTESQKEINELKIKLEQGRNIRTGILGSNLENDFAAKMPTFFNEDLFEKTTKAIAGRKPDFKLSILNHETKTKPEVIGSILFELKNQEIPNLSSWEAKLTSELEEWNAKFGIIIWTHAKAPFVRSTINRQIFIVNTDLEIIVLIVNILKILIKREHALTTAKITNADFLITQEKFKRWLETDFNKLIGKAHKEFDNFEKNLEKIAKAHEQLAKVRANLYDILINEVNIKIKNFI